MAIRGYRERRQHTHHIVIHQNRRVDAEWSVQLSDERAKSRSTEAEPSHRVTRLPLNFFVFIFCWPQPVSRPRLVYIPSAVKSFKMHDRLQCQTKKEREVNILRNMQLHEKGQI